MAAASAEMGNGTAAAAHAHEVLVRQPSFTIESYLATLHYKQREDRDHYHAALVKAGLPESAPA